MIEGCFYQNETEHWILLGIGETGYNGLVKHTCDRYDDYPGRVQYYAEVFQFVYLSHKAFIECIQSMPMRNIFSFWEYILVLYWCSLQ